MIVAVEAERRLFESDRPSFVWDLGVVLCLLLILLLLFVGLWK